MSGIFSDGCGQFSVWAWWSEPAGSPANSLKIHSIFSIYILTAAPWCVLCLKISVSPPRDSNPEPEPGSPEQPGAGGGDEASEYAVPRGDWWNVIWYDLMVKPESLMYRQYQRLPEKAMWLSHLIGINWLTAISIRQRMRDNYWVGFVRQEENNRGFSLWFLDSICVDI